MWFLEIVKIGSYLGETPENLWVYEGDVFHRDGRNVFLCVQEWLHQPQGCSLLSCSFWSSIDLKRTHVTNHFISPLFTWQMTKWTWISYYLAILFHSNLWTFKDYISLLGSNLSIILVHQRFVLHMIIILQLPRNEPQRPWDNVIYKWNSYIIT